VKGSTVKVFSGYVDFLYMQKLTFATQCPVKQQLTHLACHFVWLLRCFFQLHSTAILPQSLLADKQNYFATLRHSSLYMALVLSCHSIGVDLTLQSL
jgi:hypothetical protein